MREEPSSFPLRPLTALLLALAAQTMLEPPARVPVAIGLYALAVILFFHGAEYSASTMWYSAKSGKCGMPSRTTPPPRLLPLLISLPLLAAAFIISGTTNLHPSIFPSG
ncbi:MAG: hypothetical protein HY867_15885 [Chloroflexi bacterium]|nr:hypothetical protein [Chloroflexota bacterium]